MKASIALTGATGMLGRYIRRILDASDHEVFVVSRPTFDMSQPALVGEAIKEFRPSVLIHLAAETDVDLCERDPTRAYLINSEATRAIARACRDTGTRMIYVSTSAVFGSDTRFFYNELDIPKPISYYALSKFAGEEAVRELCAQSYAIVRAGWMVGGGAEFDHKFVGKIIQQIRGGTSELKAVCDKYGSITRAHSLARFLYHVAVANLEGVFHYASEGVTNRFEIAKAIAQKLEFKGHVSGVSSDMFPLSAPRPRSDGITSIRLGTIPADLRPQSWHDDLESYLNEF